MEVAYNKHYYAGSRQELVAKIAAELSDFRFRHVLGVEKAALELAQNNGVDLELASVAALVHDYAKEKSDQEFLAMIDACQLDSDLKNWSNFIWHGVVGAEIIRQELGIEDEAILNAVRRHTVGAVNMTRLDQIVYVADYIEENRDFPGVKTARAIAKNDLKEAVAFETSHTLAHLIANEKTIYPAAISTYNAWVCGR
ncbi:bis(5'-nucleosyl)-tetraphosphatase (symmetrical) YqeK [Ligilactobacillus equi]